MNKNNSNILKLLKEDARYSAKEIAVMLSLTKEDVAAAISQMENDGTIVKYTTIINSEKLCENKVQAIIEVKVTPERKCGFDSIAEAICKFDEVKTVTLMSGGYDLSIMIEGSSIKEIALFVSQKLSVLSNVISTATHFVLKNYKIEGIAIEEKEIERIEQL